MKKFINSVDSLLDETLQGFSKAHADIIKFNEFPHFVARKQPTRQGKVALVQVMSLYISALWVQAC